MLLFTPRGRCVCAPDEVPERAVAIDDDCEGETRVEMSIECGRMRLRRGT